MEQPPGKDCRRDHHQAKDLVALVSFTQRFATCRGIDLCEVRLGAGVNQGSTLLGRKDSWRWHLELAACHAQYREH
jgi:hypothetical protein